MEKIKINKERTWVFSLVNQIAIKVDIKGNIAEEQLRKAIRDTVFQYEMFHQKIVLEHNGDAYYENTKFYEPVIIPMEMDWKDEVKQQEKVPFSIERGELIRFFFKMTQTGATILIIAHHIAGDGISFAYLVQDIMRSLSAIKIEHKKLKLLNMDELPKEARLRAPITWLLKYMNRKWKQTGRKFDFNDYGTIYNKYWDNRETLIYTCYLDEDIYNSISRYSKENQITVNTIITTALVRASGELCDVGMAASIREKGYTGMGNYATGISIKYQYNEEHSFKQNAEMIQKLIYDKLNHAAKKYFLLQFMGNVEPTLIDAIYFNACGDYNNKTAATFSKMFGYSGNPKGISITNLTKLPIETKFGNYEMTDFAFVPPLVMNAKRIIGAATFGDKMILTLHIKKDTEAEKHLEFFNKGMEYLKTL